MANETTLWSEWRLWGGGTCPVAPDTEIEVELRNGKRFVRKAPDQLIWSELNLPSDIIAYRTKLAAAPSIDTGNAAPISIGKPAARNIEFEINSFFDETRLKVERVQDTVSNMQKEIDILRTERDKLNAAPSSIVLGDAAPIPLWQNTTPKNASIDTVMLHFSRAQDAAFKIAQDCDRLIASNTALQEKFGSLRTEHDKLRAELTAALERGETGVRNAAQNREALRQIAHAIGGFSGPYSSLPTHVSQVMGKMNVGKEARKIKGYSFPGEIRATFTTKAGHVRFVIEATGDNYAGMLHIFSPEQVEIVE